MSNMYMQALVFIGSTAMIFFSEGKNSTSDRRVTGNSVAVAIAGEEVNLKTVLLTILMLNGKESAPIRYCTYTQNIKLTYGWLGWYALFQTISYNL